MLFRSFNFIIAVGLILALLSCALISRDIGDIKCEKSHVEENIYRVKCWGQGDVSPLAVQSKFQDYSMNVCRDNGYAYFAFGGEEPALSTSYGSIIECTE